MESDENETLFAAIENESPTIVEDLLKMGYNPNVTNSKGLSPLHLAIHVRNLEIAKLLLEHNADVNFEDTNGETPIHYAVSRENIKMVKKNS